MNRHTSASARSKDTEVRVSQTTTDAPLLPIEQIGRLRELAPERVDWIFDQTEIESEYRRAETRRINTMTFAERMAGLVFALLIAVLGLGLAAYLAMNGKEITASIIGGTTIVGLVSAFILGRGGKG
ncbi:hypothetical protein [Acidovorax sp. NCPPB 4044]|uniref:hypothetical protein n=1 Tax=Acidovorax sp. NCPPB 4044 TaxID=2940490 RepID=UPI0023036D93|nr:hypothetical protein [Acidovorax sp. NCPPB 4044]